MDAAIVTHIGYVREVNEDSGLIFHEQDSWLAALIADGMGGHQAGDVASQMTVKAIKEVLSEGLAGLTVEAGRELVQKAVAKANREVFQYALEHVDCQGMGTTVAFVLLASEWGIVAHIGDSRVYFFQEKDLQLLTEDHSLVHELLRKGQISKEEASEHPQKNVLMRALGTEETVEVDVNTFDWKPGDQLLLCSDGLSNKVTGETMKSMLEQNETAQKKCESLVRQALEAGGEDNISVIVIDNKNEDPGQESEVK